jgi:DNA-binding GntR family transcriptional regulator
VVDKKQFRLTRFWPALSEILDGAETAAQKRLRAKAERAKKEDAAEALHHDQHAALLSAAGSRDVEDCIATHAWA